MYRVGKQDENHQGKKLNLDTIPNNKIILGGFTGP